ncbi:MAG: glutathionylspermidine synthase family protein [Hyphomonadaceae bacterium]|nr:glutathionylspermidine synthase family protein [Hyphomonadaceae bacterium]
MRRERVAPRPDWVARLEALEFDVWRHADGRPYWREDACFVLDEGEVEALHAAAEQAVAMIDEAVAAAFDGATLASLGVEGVLAKAARSSWAARAPSVYGRLDFAWDTQGPRLLEFNADTPTALYEAAVVQWHWLMDRDPGADQYNAIHEALLGVWTAMRGEFGPRAHFACMREHPDDLLTTDYLRDIAVQAGFEATLLDVGEIGWDGSRLVDLDEAPIQTLFKLYPWEWMAAEAFGPHLARTDATIIEPAWRIAASSKALLADLWAMNEGHPVLLPASRDPHALSGDVMEKGWFGREGAQVRRRAPGGPVSAGVVYQQRTAMTPFDGLYPVFGVWVAGGRPCGLGIREDADPVTGVNACFIPHRIG